MTDAYTHMESAWGYDENPFPGDAVSSSPQEPHSPDVFRAEELEFRTKVVRGAIQGKRKMTHLWSIGQFGGDTGHGKTSLMRAAVKDINDDWGGSVQDQVGVRPERQKMIAAGFTEVDEHGHNGLYPVTFALAQEMATPDGILVKARDLIVEETGENAAVIMRKLSATRLAISPTGPPLRPDLLDAFASSVDEFAYVLSEVTPTTQLRSGIYYFAFVLNALAAAGVKKCFVMFDQMEDLGKKGAITAAKRRKEIGRIRDLLEQEPYASLLHMSFTFHQRAAGVLATDWELNRLPSFEPVSANSAAVVVLRGLRDDDQVEALLKVWMLRVAAVDGVAPFTRDALTALRAHSEGRPGYALRFANEVWMAAAEQQLGAIDGAFIDQHLGDSSLPDRTGVAAAGDGATPSSIADELLA